MESTLYALYALRMPTLTPTDVPALVTERLGKAPGLCRWFAFCDHEADDIEQHPSLGDVPICTRCKTRVARLRQLNRVPEGDAA